MKKIYLITVAILLVGCSRITEMEDHKAITADEQKCVREQMLNLAPTKNLQQLTLAGHDQDWDDAISAAYRSALKSCTPPRLFEMICDAGGCRSTGKWRNFQ